MTTIPSPEIGLKRRSIQISSWVLALLQWGGLAAALAGLGLFVALNLDYAQARFPGSQPVGAAQFGLGSVSSGRLSETQTYRTPADLATVTHWYQGRLGAETPADDTVNARAGCSTVMSTQQWAFIRRAFEATLCSRSSGTSMYVHQTVTLWR
jgi:hypothetical protein